MLDTNFPIIGHSNFVPHFDAKYVTAAQMVMRAMSTVGRAYISSPVRSECFDCIAMVNEITGAHIDGDWMENGGELPFERIGLSEARPGDLLVFDMPWKHRRNHVAVMTLGDDVNDPHARMTGPYLGHASAEIYLAPMFRRYLVAAYRVEVL